MKNWTTYWIKIDVDELYLYGQKNDTTYFSAEHIASISPIMLKRGQTIEVRLPSDCVINSIGPLLYHSIDIIVDGKTYKNYFYFMNKVYTISSLLSMGYIQDITKQIERNTKLEQLIK